MKKYHLFLLLFTLIIVPAFQSCNNEDEIKTYSYAVGTIMKNESNNYYLDLDSHKKLLLSDSTLLNYSKLSTGDRIVASFYILDQNADGYDYVVNMFDLYKILIKPIIKLTPEITDSIGDDRALITNMWIHNDLLNIEFKVAGTGMVQHMINIVTTDTPKEPEEGFASLEFRHNREGDTEERFYSGIMSFRLGDFAPSTKEMKGLKIRVKTFYEGEKVYTLKYDRSQATLNTPYKSNQTELNSMLK